MSRDELYELADEIAARLGVDPETVMIEPPGRLSLTIQQVRGIMAPTSPDTNDITLMDNNALVSFIRRHTTEGLDGWRRTPDGKVINFQISTTNDLRTIARQIEAHGDESSRG